MDLSSTPRARFSRRKFISPGAASPYRSPLMHSLPEKKVQSSFENISDVLNVPTTALEDKRDLQKKKIHQVHQKFVSPIATSSAYQSPLAYSQSIHEKRSQSSFENISDGLKVPTAALEDKKDAQKKNIHQVHQKFVSPIATFSAYQSPLAHNHMIPKRKVQSPPECLSLDEMATSNIHFSEESETLKEKMQHLEHKKEKSYIEKLHRYNEIKDVAQMVMGRLAIMEQKTMKEVYEDFGVTEND